MRIKLLSFIISALMYMCFMITWSIYVNIDTLDRYIFLGIHFIIYLMFWNFNKIEQYMEREENEE